MLSKYREPGGITGPIKWCMKSIKSKRADVRQGVSNQKIKSFILRYENLTLKKLSKLKKNKPSRNKKESNSNLSKLEKLLRSGTKMKILGTAKKEQNLPSRTFRFEVSHLSWLVKTNR